MDNTSGVGVLDKAAIVLSALEAGPSTLAQARHGHRPGPPDGPPPRGRARAPPPRRPGHAGPLRPRPAARRAWPPPPARTACSPPPARCSAHCATTPTRARRLFRRQGDHRICVSAAERPVGLRDSIPIGASLTMLAGSAAQVLLAWEEPDRLHRGLQGAAFNATTLSGVRRRGWSQSVGEREPGVASVSAPVRSPPVASSPPCRSRGRSSVSRASPDGCTRPRSSRAPTRLTEVLARHAKTAEEQHSA